MIRISNEMISRAGGGLLQLLAPWANVLGLALILSFIATVAAAAWYFPSSNWDMFAYLAAAYEAPGVSVAALHHHAYETMRQSIPAGDFIVLTQDRLYRVRQYADAEAFFSMLGFYRVKFLYVEALSWLSQIVDPYTAIRVLSVVPALMTGLFLAYWLVREGALHLSPLVVALLLVVEFGEGAREGAPDMLSAMFFVAAMFAFIRGREAWVAMLLFLAFLVRPDNAAYIGVLMVVSVFFRSFSWGAAAAFFTALVVYFPMTEAGGHPGWWTHMWFTHVEYVQTLEGFDPDFSVLVYLQIVVRVIVRALVEETWLAAMLIGVAIWWQMILRGFQFRRRETAVIVATLLAMAAKMVVFPLHETRFHMAYVIVFGMVIICALRDVRFLPEPKSAARNHSAS